MIIPPKLQPGDEIRVIAPSRSLSILSEGLIDYAKEKIEQQGFSLTFSKNCREINLFHSSSVLSRVEDLHAAFLDEQVKAIFTVIGGYNSNQLLQHLNYDLISSHPKILCGYSDITALTHAISAKTGLVTYSGPHFSTWGMHKAFEYNLEYFKKSLMQESPFAVQPSETWSDDAWYLDQENRNIFPNEGFKVIYPGAATGRIWGGNLCTFNLLQGTEFMPDLTDAILFLEDDDLAGNNFAREFDRNLQSLIHQPDFHKVKGLVIGRFQQAAEMDWDKLQFILGTQETLRHIPILANVDFGHTNPMITFPIGGTASLEIGENVRLKILTH